MKLVDVYALLALASFLAFSFLVFPPLALVVVGVFFVVMCVVAFLNEVEK